MAKKKRRQQQPAVPPETRAAEAVTIAWMLAIVTTLICGTSAVAVWAVTHAHEDAGTAVLLVHFLHFSAIVTGLVSLLLLAGVLKLRRVPPPRGITVFALIVALLPILTALL